MLIAVFFLINALYISEFADGFPPKLPITSKQFQDYIPVQAVTVKRYPYPKRLFLFDLLMRYVNARNWNAVRLSCGAMVALLFPSASRGKSRRNIF